MLRRVCILCPRDALPGGSRCSQHERSNWNRYKPAHAPVYRTRQWTDLRKRVLREEPICAAEGCQERSTSVDHVVSLADGGEPYARSNVRGMCRHHHRKRSSQQGAQAKNKEKP